MQRVIKTVYTNLSDLKLAIDGTIVMSNYLRDSLDAMYDGKIPDRWTKVEKILISKIVCIVSSSYIYLYVHSSCLFSQIIKITLTIEFPIIIITLSYYYDMRDLSSSM